MKRILILLVLPALVECYPNNAAAGACPSMIPSGHMDSSNTNPPSQAFPSPFTVTADSNTYTPGQQIKVSLKAPVCGRKFKGFLLQARVASTLNTSTSGIGSFTNADGQSQPWCDVSGGSGKYGITHTSNADKTSVDVTWTAPSAASGHVVFIVTFVESKISFWVKQMSTLIQDSSQSNVPTYPGVPSPVLQATVCEALLTKPAGCGSTLGCFHDCGSSGCNYIITWVSGSSAVKFTITAKFPGITEGYIALGFSEDMKMGSDGVTECVYLNNAVSIYNSQNNGRSNTRMATTIAKAGSGSYTDGTFTCAFEIPKPNSNQMLNVEKERYLLYARGTKVSANNIAKHSSRPIASGSAVNFQKMTDLTGQQSVNTLVKVHGSLMVVAWIFAASIGIVIARYYKPQWPENTCCGEKVWFQMHRSFMIIVFLAGAAAFVIIFVDVKGYSDLGQEASKRAHPILGIIVTSLMVVNPIMAIFRPHPGDANRPIFNWAHFGVGSAAHILAVVTVFLGVNLGKPAIPKYVTWILVGYVAWQVLIEFLLVFVRCKTESKERQESYELSQKGTQNTDQTKTVVKSSPIRQGLLLLHIAAVTAFATAVVIIINIS